MDIKGGWIPFHLDRSRKLGIYFYSLKLYCVLNIVTNLLRRQVQYPTYFQELYVLAIPDGSLLLLSPNLTASIATSGRTPVGP